MHRIVIVLALAAAVTVRAEEPIEKTKKNIKVLTGLPSSQLIPVMSFMANSLGVACAHCHTKDFASDEKPAKEVARDHIRMTQTINAQHFKSTRIVTCNSCHRGRVATQATPLVADAAYNRTQDSAKLPPVEEVLKRYTPLAPLRGVAGAVERWNGRDAPVSGTFSIDAEGKFDTAFSFPPEAARALMTQPPREMFAKASTIATENVRGRNAYVVAAEPKEGLPEIFFFDVETGQLLRRRRFTRTPIGDLPEEVDYHGTTRTWSRADYRVTFSTKP